MPAWWQDAKLGIFVHWVPASVPAFAPVDVDVGQMMQSGRRDAFAYSPYSEWYENSLRFPDSPVARHHRETYGDRPYVKFAADWEAGLDQWDPQEWATRFAATGARYVVLVTKHMDGYCLWPTDVTNPHRARMELPARRRRRAERGRARRGDALRDLLLRRARLDLQRPADGIAGRDARRSAAWRLSGLRRGPGP